MHHNPFEIFDVRLSNIEVLLSDLKLIHLVASGVPANESRFGNFKWYINETGQAESTARQRIARGEVPGVTKMGKKLLFEKAVVLQSIKDHQRKTNDELTTAAEEEFAKRHTIRAKEEVAV
ncbi:hypothetical protein [Spirosoma pollinicola]|uniref:Uncharacterized protein n=1 Tax=Spirosoma pollinicola TaxID=2057025 RepID=A0A2K8Z459_9BACT|nr:hypothetical protein [Spirosoma pollinicola]AUD04652.1 hypothetical protein CWM47_24060 [Spirosoma pollinicola]